MNLLINYIPLPAVLVNSSSNTIESFNKEAIKLFCIQNSEELIHLPINQFLPNKYLKKGVFKPNKIKAFGVYLREVEIKVEEITDHNHQHLLITFQNEYKLRNEFKEVFEGASDGILLVGKRLKVLNANRAFSEITQLDTKEVIGKGSLLLARKFLKGKRFNAALNGIKSIVKGESVPPFELNFNGKCIAISANINQSSSFYVVLFRDVSAYKEANLKIEESRQRYRSLIETIKDSVFVLYNHKIIFANKKLVEISGRSKRELEGRNFLDFIAPEERERVSTFYLNRISTSKKLSTNYQSMGINKEGKKIPVEVQVENIYFDGKQCLLVVLRDIRSQLEASKKIRESEENFRLLASNTFDGILISNAHGRHLYANKQAEKITGYSLEELQSLSILDLSVQQFRAEISTKLKEQFNHNESISRIEFPLLNKDGREVQIELTASHTYWLGEKAQIVTIRDITKQKLAEKEKRSIEKKHQELTELLPEIVFETDANLNVTFSNKIAIERIGINYQQIKDKSFNIFSYIDKEDQKRFAESVQNNLQNKASSGSTYKFNVPAIGIKYFQFFNSPIVRDGKVTGIRGFAVDVTKRKATEDQLRRSEHLLDTILENMPGGFLLIDENYIIQRVNQLTCELTGFSKEELEGKQCDIICPKGKESKQCPIFAMGQTSFSGMDTHVKCKNNTQLPILKNAISLTIEGKQYLVESFLDIKAQKENERNLVHAISKAKEADKLKSAFLANMSHEIRTPMNGIIGFTNLLKIADLSPEKQSLFINTIEKSSMRLLDTVNDLLEISRIESGLMKVYPTELDLHTMLSDHYHFFQEEAHSKNLELHFRHDTNGLSTLIINDRSKLDSIFSNLIKNAIKFTESGAIEISYTMDMENFTFTCKDDGVGIPTDRQRAIFNRFEQADISNTQANQGTGLGLSITKAYVEMLHGEIQLESKEGVGTTFKLIFPRQIWVGQSN